MTLVAMFRVDFAVPATWPRAGWTEPGISHLLRGCKSEEVLRESATWNRETDPGELAIRWIEHEDPKDIDLIPFHFKSITDLPVTAIGFSVMSVMGQPISWNAYVTKHGVTPLPHSVDITAWALHAPEAARNAFSRSPCELVF